MDNHAAGHVGEPFYQLLAGDRSTRRLAQEISTFTVTVLPGSAPLECRIPAPRPPPWND